MSGSREHFLDLNEVMLVTAAELKKQQEWKHFDQVVLGADIQRDKRQPEAQYHPFADFDGYVIGLGVKLKTPVAIFAMPTTVNEYWNATVINDQVYHIIKAQLSCVNKRGLKQELERDTKLSIFSGSTPDPYDFDLYIPLSNGSGSSGGNHWNYVRIKFRKTDASVLENLQTIMQKEAKEQVELQQAKNAEAVAELTASLQNKQTMLAKLKNIEEQYGLEAVLLSGAHNRTAKENLTQNLEKVKQAMTKLESKEEKSNETVAPTTIAEITAIIETNLQKKAGDDYRKALEELQASRRDVVNSLLASLYDEITIEFTDSMHWPINLNVLNKLCAIFPLRQCEYPQGNAPRPKETLPFSYYTVLWFIIATLISLAVTASLSALTLAIIGGFWGILSIAVSIILILELVYWGSQPLPIPVIAPTPADINPNKSLYYFENNDCPLQDDGYTCGDRSALGMVRRAAGVSQVDSRPSSQIRMASQAIFPPQPRLALASPAGRKSVLNLLSLGRTSKQPSTKQSASVQILSSPKPSILSATNNALSSNTLLASTPPPVTGAQGPQFSIEPSGAQALASTSNCFKPQ